MNSKLFERIIDIKNKRDAEIYTIKEKYQNQLNDIVEQCSSNNHIDDDGNSALIQAGHPFHTGWDNCKICGKYVETNPYERD